MGISVRPAQIADLSFVSQDGYTRPGIIEKKVREGEVFVAELDGIAAGYIRIEFLWSVQPYVSLIRVLESHRRKGVGRAMLSYVEDTLRGAGHRVLFSSSQVDESEPRAWHGHMGFEECGIISGLNDGGVGEVFFRKVL